jgi:hypothetical protein
MALLIVRRRSSFPVLPGVLYPNETLLRYGYLGCSPVQPTLAFSIRTLAAYRQSHRTCPRFSIEAQCRMLCHMHDVRQPLIYVLFILSYTKFRYHTMHTFQLNFLWLSMRIWKYADKLTSRSILPSSVILTSLILDDLVPVAFTNWRVSLNWNSHPLFQLMATIRLNAWVQLFGIQMIAWIPVPLFRIDGLRPKK